MCQEAVRRLCNPSESCHVRKVARLLAQALMLRSSKAVNESAPPMPWRSGSAAPHPWFRFAIQLPGGDPRCLTDLVAVGEIHPGQRLPPEKPPPRLDEV